MRSLWLVGLLALSACATTTIGKRTYIDDRFVKVWSDEQLHRSNGVIDEEAFRFYATSRSGNNLCILLSFTNSSSGAKWDSGATLLRPGQSDRLIETVPRNGAPFGLKTDARAWPVAGTDCSMPPT